MILTNRLELSRRFKMSPWWVFLCWRQMMTRLGYNPYYQSNNQRDLFSKRLVPISAHLGIWQLYHTPIKYICWQWQYSCSLETHGKCNSRGNTLCRALKTNNFLIFREREVVLLLPFFFFSSNRHSGNSFLCISLVSSTLELCWILQTLWQYFYVPLNCRSIWVHILWSVWWLYNKIMRFLRFIIKHMI